MNDIDADREEFLSRLRRMNAETDKFVAEQRKLISASQKLASEERKLDRDRWLSPWLAIAGLVGGLLAIANFVTQAMRHP